MDCELLHVTTLAVIACTDYPGWRLRRVRADHLWFRNVSALIFAINLKKIGEKYKFFNTRNSTILMIQAFSSSLRYHDFFRRHNTIIIMRGQFSVTWTIFKFNILSALLTASPTMAFWWNSLKWLRILVLWSFFFQERTIFLCSRKNNHCLNKLTSTTLLAKQFSTI